MLELRKWYGDCVSESGDTAVSHWASLRWGPLRIPYSAVLRCAPDGRASERIAWRSSPEPAFDDGTLAWTQPRTGARATWSSLAPPTEITLIASASCTIRWVVHVPSGEVHFAFENGDRLHGLGYAEFLIVSLAQRYLPMTELRWGRFVSRGASLAWIDWRGETPGSWGLLDGVPVGRTTVSDTGVTVHSRDVTLTFQDRTALRSAALRNGALRGIPVLARWPLRRFGHAMETRWRSRALLRLAGTEHSGWAIHETVHFPG